MRNSQYSLMNCKVAADSKTNRSRLLKKSSPGSPGAAYECRVGDVRVLQQRNEYGPYAATFDYGCGDAATI